MRLIAVVLGAPTLMRRTELAEGLFAEGFSDYALMPVPWQQVVPATVAVYGGTARAVSLETAAPVAVLLRRGTRAALSISEAITARPLAPFARAQAIGTLTVALDGHPLVETPLLAAAQVDRASLFGTRVGLRAVHGGTRVPPRANDLPRHVRPGGVAASADRLLTSADPPREFTVQ